MSILLDRFVAPFLFGSYPELDSAVLFHTGLLIAPFVYYSFLWQWPGTWCRFSESINISPALLCSYVAHVLKLGQFYVLLTVGGAVIPSQLATPINSLLPAAYVLRSYTLEFTPLTILEIILVLLGQALNLGVYATLGTTGVYYGVRFGEQVPWVTGFPFNLGFPDPQYWGCILTLVGLLNLFQLKNQPYYVFVLVLAYLVMMGVESKQRTPAYVKSKKT
jgi:methylene-fatty-acyl-phospholipid synthase